MTPIRARDHTLREFRFTHDSIRSVYRLVVFVLRERNTSGKVMNEVAKVSVNFQTLYSGYCTAGVCVPLYLGARHISFCLNDVSSSERFFSGKWNQFGMEPVDD